MSVGLVERLKEQWRLVRLCARLVGGRRYWLAPVLPLTWPLASGLWLAFHRGAEGYQPADAQNTLIGAPLAVLAIGLGVRVIAGEVDRRMLEIGYTTPGGVHRLWLAKLTACLGLLLASEGLLGGAAFLFMTSFPPLALWGALQSAVFFLVVAMAFAALSRSEVTGALLGFAALFLAMIFGEVLGRWSPFWNEAAHRDANPADLLAWSLQNRIGFALFTVAISALAFARAERREQMLGG